MSKSINKKFYLLGNPVEHSISPIMQQIFLDYYKIEGEYNPLCIDVQNLETTLLSLQYNDVTGINITLPYKELVMQYLNFVSDDARMVGCVNTIKFNNGLSIGYNTDVLRDKIKAF